MIFKNKTEIAIYLNCWRWKIYDMIKRKEIKEIYIWKVKGYVIVLDFIKYLLE